ncbi:MAG: LytR C-terminal domain-containing protein [Elusimicrobia bacterium]|nr:LytR C-terminal domain-containing protein [Elusimicrobiota bacterium]
MTARLLAPGVSGASVPPPSRTGSGLLAGALLAATAGVWFVETRAPLADRIRTLQPFAVWTVVRPPARETPLFFLSLHQPSRGTVDLVFVPGDYKLGHKETVAAAFKRAAAGAQPLTAPGVTGGKGPPSPKAGAVLRSPEGAGAGVPPPLGTGSGLAAARAVCARLHERLFSLPSMGWLDLGQPRFLYDEPASFPAGDPAVVMKRKLLREFEGLPFWKSLPALLKRPGVDVLLPPALVPGVDSLLPSRLRERGERLSYALELHRAKPGAIRPAWLPEEASLESFLLRALGRGDESPRPKDRPVTAEVLNATPLKGIATDATKVIRLRGADVLQYGNTEREHPGTLVYDRTGRFENAMLVLGMMGCPSAEAVTRIRERTLVEVSVIVGEDCAGAGIRQPPERQSRR